MYVDALFESAERPAQVRDVDRQDALFDKRLRPDTRQQLLLGHEPAGLADQRHQHIMRLRRQMHGHTVAQ